MGLRPEWPWRARRKINSSPDESVQYWNLFLLPPPPVILLFHISSDQNWEHSNSFRRSSVSLQNSIAPSSSRGKCPCRRRVFTLFATGYVSLNWAPGSISVHILSRIGTILVDEQVVESLLGCALALYRLANANTSVFVSEVSCSLSSHSLSIKICDQLVQSMSNSDPRVIIVFVYRFNSNFHSIFSLQAAGCDL